MREEEYKNKIDELQKEIDRLKKLAYKDELTGGYNRRGFNEEVAKFLKEVQAYRKKPERRESVLIKDLSVVLFDIDNFKKVNDTYGHDAGDEVLKHVVGAVQRRVRSIDLVSRWGGEEILVALVGASENEAYEVAEDIRKNVSRSPVKTASGYVQITISGGVASCSGEDFDSVVKRADEALYKAKKSGKNRIVRASTLS